MQNKNHWYRNFRFKLFALLCAIAVLASAVFVSRQPALARSAAAGDARAAETYQGNNWLRSVSWGPGRLDIFMRSQFSGGVKQKTFDNNQWSAWIDLGNPSGSGLSSIEAVSWGFGRLDVFGVASNRVVWHKAWDGLNWGAWENIGLVSMDGGVTGASEIRAISWGPGRIDLFPANTVLASGNTVALLHKWYSGSVWGPSQTGWETIGTGAASAGYSIDAVSWGPNRLDVFRRTFDTSSLDRRYWDGSWKPVFAGQPLWGNMSSGTSPSTPSAVSWSANAIHVLVRGTDGAVWINGTGDGTNWTGWNSLGGGGSASYGPVTVDSWAWNRLDVFENRKISAHSGNIYHKAWNGSAWGAWEHLGAIADGRAPDVVSWSANRLDFFVYVADGVSNGIYHKWWDGSNWGPSQTGAWEFFGNP